VDEAPAEIEKDVLAKKTVKESAVAAAVRKSARKSVRVKSAKKPTKKAANASRQVKTNPSGEKRVTRSTKK
jgi:hypothetical protein